MPDIIPVDTILAAEIATGPVQTLLGEEIMLLNGEGDVQIFYKGKMINGVTADKKASNGVIHIIDNVIL